MLLSVQISKFFATIVFCHKHPPTKSNYSHLLVHSKAIALIKSRGLIKMKLHYPNKIQRKFASVGITKSNLWLKEYAFIGGKERHTI
jgi:hypothetical protein